MTKRRGKRRSRRSQSPEKNQRAPRRPDSDLELAVQRAERWIHRHRPEKALKLLEPLLASHEDVADVHALLGYARAEAGDLWGALSAHETASALDDDPLFLFPKAVVSFKLGLTVHALRVFREMIERRAATPVMNDLRAAVASHEKELAAAARRLGIPVGQMEKGLYHMEEAHIALNSSSHKPDFEAAIAANRGAIRYLGDYPPPHNNLSQALFYAGRIGPAVDEVHQVLSSHPRNLQALSNGVRFLGWMGREDEARALWARLEPLAPEGASERLKKAEAAAILSDHESVYQVLKPLEDPADDDIPPSLADPVQFFLAVAEANTGRRTQACRRLRDLGPRATPLAAEYLAALEEGRSGRGWADHFPYFHLAELLPDRHIDALLDLARQESEMPPEHFRRRVARFVERFPQIVRAAEKMIWEEQQPEAGVQMLSMIGTPAAYAALRRFGLSQAGSDQDRRQALAVLARVGEISEDEPVRVWIDGEWHEARLQFLEVPGFEGRMSEYDPQAIDRLNQAMVAFSRGDSERAEELFEQVLELDPDVKEAYNNLAAIYARRGESARAIEMLRQAVAIDPLYALARCNLATFLLDDDRVEEAEEMLQPLSDARDLSAQEAAFHKYLQARILALQGEYDDAERVAKVALKIQPGYKPARQLLEGLESAIRMQRNADAYWERQRKRDLAWRERLQDALTTATPSLAEALPLYTKNALTGMAREVIPYGGWSSLRKAELIDEIIGALTDRSNLTLIVEGLDQTEQQALGTVLEHGGTMPWHAFDERYDNDLEASRYWDFHVPESTMGRLRFHGLLVETTVDDELRIAVPDDLRGDLQHILGLTQTGG